jgi:hypothetical protein
MPTGSLPTVFTQLAGRRTPSRRKICPGNVRPAHEPHHPESPCDATIASTDSRAGMSLSETQIARWNPEGSRCDAEQ